MTPLFVAACSSFVGPLPLVGVVLTPAVDLAPLAVDLAPLVVDLAPLIVDHVPLIVVLDHPVYTARARPPKAEG